MSFSIKKTRNSSANAFSESTKTSKNLYTQTPTTEILTTKFSSNRIFTSARKPSSKKCSSPNNNYDFPFVIKNPKEKNLISSDDRTRLRSINKKVANEIKTAETISDKKDNFKLLCQSVKYNKRLKFKLDTIINYKPLDKIPKIIDLKNKTIRKKEIIKGTTTLLFRSSEKVGDYFEKLKKIKQDQILLKKAFKWKNLKWLLENKKFQVEKLIKSYLEMRWYFKKYTFKVTRKSFNEIMNLLQLDNDTEFCDNVFYFFDDDKDDTLDFRELVVGLETFRDDHFYDKMKSHH